MKILQVVYSGLGGTGTVAFSLIDGFESNDVENYMLFFGIEPISENYLKILSETTSVKDYFFVLKKTKFSFKEQIEIFRYFVKVKPDILLLHNPKLIIISFLYRVLHKVRIVTVEHDSISDRTGYKWLFTNFNSILANKNIVLTVPYLTVIQKKLWIKKFKNKYVIIPNGINTSVYSPLIAKNKSDEFTIFMAARFGSNRDQGTLIEAVLSLNKKNKKINLRLAGEGEKKEFFMGKYCKNKNILFLGNITSEKIVSELQNADLYVHASFSETFSTSILQAMSCGVPIIASDIDGIKHMINNYRNGILYKSSDINDLKNKIKLVLNKKIDVSSLISHAHSDINNNYHIDKVVKLYLNAMKID